MGFWKALIDDGEKAVNPAHVVTLTLTLAVIVWGSLEAYHTHAMPSRLVDAAYLLGGTAGVNVAHKFEDIVAKIKGNGNGGAA